MVTMSREKIQPCARKYPVDVAKDRLKCLGLLAATAYFSCAASHVCMSVAHVDKASVTSAQS